MELRILELVRDIYKTLDELEQEEKTEEAFEGAKKILDHAEALCTVYGFKAGLMAGRKEAENGGSDE